MKDEHIANFGNPPQLDTSDWEKFEDEEYSVRIPHDYINTELDENTYTAGIYNQKFDSISRYWSYGEEGYLLIIEKYPSLGMPPEEFAMLGGGEYPPTPLGTAILHGNPVLIGIDMIDGRGDSIWLPGNKDLETGEYRTYGLKNPDGVPGFHSGTDIDMTVGKPVFAIADGEVVFSTDTHKATYGGVVVIRHEFADGVFFSVYGHLDPNNLIEGLTNGQWTPVKRGQILGYIASYEKNGHYGPHLHFEITKDEPPMDGNGNYIWSFFGYGKAKKDLNFNNPSVEEQTYIYGTLERFGGNAINPVKFMDTHLFSME